MASAMHQRPPTQLLSIYVQPTKLTKLQSKSKVAPIKKIRLPRLDLCGAVIFARLISLIKLTLNLHHIECHAWYDSSIASARIREPSHHRQTFVANRVSAIQSSTAPESWHHIDGITNPADAASRRLTASALVNSQLWWHGPEWLSESNEHWPINHITTHL